MNKTLMSSTAAVIFHDCSRMHQMYEITILQVKCLLCPTEYMVLASAILEEDKTDGY